MGTVKVKLTYRVGGLGEEGQIVEVDYRRAGQLITANYATEVAETATATRKKATSKKAATRSTR